MHVVHYTHYTITIYAVSKKSTNAISTLEEDGREHLSEAFIDGDLRQKSVRVDSRHETSAREANTEKIHLLPFVFLRSHDLHDSRGVAGESRYTRRTSPASFWFRRFPMDPRQLDDFRFVKCQHRAT